MTTQTQGTATPPNAKTPHPNAYIDRVGEIEQSLTATLAEEFQTLCQLKDKEGQPHGKRAADMASVIEERVRLALDHEARLLKLPDTLTLTISGATYQLDGKLLTADDWEQMALYALGVKISRIGSKAVSVKNPTLLEAGISEEILTAVSTDHISLLRKHQAGKINAGNLEFNSRAPSNEISFQQIAERMQRDRLTSIEEARQALQAERTEGAVIDGITTEENDRKNLLDNIYQNLADPKHRDSQPDKLLEYYQAYLAPEEEEEEGE